MCVCVSAIVSHVFIERDAYGSWRDCVSVSYMVGLGSERISVRVCFVSVCICVYPSESECVYIIICLRLSVSMPEY